METHVSYFLDMANVCRRFLNGFAKSARLLTQLLKQRTPDTLPILHKEQLAPFKALKNNLLSTLVLKVTWLGLRYTLGLGASVSQVRCTLVQIHKNAIYYTTGTWSGTLNQAETNYSTTVK